MNWKKGLVTIPLAATIAVPSLGLNVYADDHVETPSVDTEAVELRSSLDHLLSEHVYLAVETMRKGAEGASDFDQAAGALSQNTEDLSAAIASVYGEEAGNQFNEMWSEHIGYFVDYVKATGAEDEAAKQEALDNLGQYKQEFSQFLEQATGERLEAGALAEGLQMHVNQLIGAFDAFVAGDYDKAYEYEREAMSHMYMVSKGLSDAMSNQFPEKFNDTSAVTPAADLRSDLSYLLSEHAGLAVVAMQNGIDGSEDFEASAEALSNNTEDLSNTIASVYGEEAGQQFQQMWSDHIGNFVSYVEATGAEDEQAKEQALTALEGYRSEFSSFIETATEGKVSADVMSEGLQMHVNQLIGAFDSYAMEDYEAAYGDIRAAYEHMFTPGKALSGAISAQFPDKFSQEMPSDMPKTGLAPQDTGMNSTTWLAIGGMFALITALVFHFRRQQEQ
ncbi:LPXTG cell wall anchor domain-containing protein [Salimicrobium halophilum]|uniref:LPXTG-motif cell wall anchor domain-containing protein n=1 Tax=Salimicrobium halophilum TaxID=86666 RepID=A0A1G8RGI0_9BACI|nr:LPXTG cell wall anchor domain-containing protein [Salimicrobium halophilum]SDJ16204.1 LPXTG-motif cell wall anchor domain-containing protein [Salimicrobium halophilum]